MTDNRHKRYTRQEDRPRRGFGEMGELAPVRRVQTTSPMRWRSSLHHGLIVLLALTGLVGLSRADQMMLAYNHGCDTQASLAD